MATKPGPIIVIVGQTASGKSALALELAEKFNGEIICADSRTVYKGMDIGTAKPSAEEQKRIRHHLLDVVTPDQRFTAADFKQLAEQAIKDIESRGKLPILAGGTGLYIDSILFDFQFRPVADPGLRAELEQLSLEELQHKLNGQGIPLPRDPLNPRRLIRQLETAGAAPASGPLRPYTLILGMDLEPEVIKTRIAARTNQMVKDGLVEESKQLLTQYGDKPSAFDAPAYRPMFEYLNGTMSLEDATLQFIQNDVHLAKRQKTWFKRNKSIQWVRNSSEAVEIATTFLSRSV